MYSAYTSVHFFQVPERVAISPACRRPSPRMLSCVGLSLGETGRWCYAKRSPTGDTRFLASLPPADNASLNRSRGSVPPEAIDGHSLSRTPGAEYSTRLFSGHCQETGSGAGDARTWTRARTQIGAGPAADGSSIVSPLAPLGESLRERAAFCRLAALRATDLFLVRACNRLECGPSLVCGVRVQSPAGGN